MPLLSPEFLLTSLIVVASPGTGAVYTIAAGLSRGAKPAVLAAVLHQSALALEAVKYAGVAYLIWMALSALREDGPLRVDAGKPQSAFAVLLEGVAINLMNPKLSIFFLAFLPQFVGPTDPSPTQSMIALSMVFVAMTFAIFALYGVFAARMRDHVITRPRVMAWLRRGFAAAFLALGAKLALADR